MFTFQWVVGKVLMPERFFGLEVIDRIVGKRVKNQIELRCIRLERNLTGELVEQLHEFTVLFVDSRQACIEVVIPREDIDGVHCPPKISGFT